MSEIKPDSLSIGALVQESYARSKRKGWYDGSGEPGSADRNIPEMLALIHSEISEALEAYRDTSNSLTFFHRVSPDGGYFLSECQYQEQNKASENRPWKPDGFPIELADAVIRIADLCGYLGIDLEKAIRVKSDFNETRPFKHGGKRC